MRFKVLELWNALKRTVWTTLNWAIYIRQLILGKNEIPLIFNSIFRHNDRIYPHNFKSDIDREKRDLSEYVIRFPVAFTRFEVFHYKVSHFLSIFADFLLIFGINGEPGLSRFSWNDCQTCQLTSSNRICSYKCLKWEEHH